MDLELGQSGSLNYLFFLGGDQAIHIYGHFEGFPLYCIAWVSNRMPPENDLP